MDSGWCGVSPKSGAGDIAARVRRLRGACARVVFLIGLVVSGSVVCAGLEALADSAVALQLTVGQSRVVEFATPMSRVSVAHPDIADVTVSTPTQLIVTGVARGQTSLVTWVDGRAVLYDVAVEPNLSALTEALARLAPADEVEARFAGNALVLQGEVSNSFLIPQAEALARGYSEQVVNLLRAPPEETHQVQIHVRFAEVNRAALNEMGLDLFFTDLNFSNNYSLDSGHFTAQASQIQNNATTGLREFILQTNATAFLGIANAERSINAIFQVLEATDDVQVLAEPTLIVVSGGQGSFLAGGEFPLPQVDADTGQVRSYDFKEFGVKLNFAPVILEDGGIRLDVQPEVSDLDFSNGLVVSGIQIPLFRTRKVQTSVELGNGDSLIIGGLINHISTEELRQLPVLGDLPIVGMLFRSTRFRNEETELVVVITPSFVRPYTPGTYPALPTDAEYLEDESPPWQLSNQPAAPAGRSPVVAAPPPAPPITLAPASAAASPATGSSPPVPGPAGDLLFDEGDAPAGIE